MFAKGVAMIRGSNALSINGQGSVLSRQAEKTGLFDIEKSQVENHSRPKTKVAFSKKEVFSDLAIILFFGLFFFLSLIFAWQRQASPLKLPCAVKVVSVAKGQNLWRIAGQHAPAKTDRRLFIKKIMELNSLSSPDLKEGQTLKVPFYRD